MTFLKWLKQQSKALVIRGPEGCGKGLLAEQLAKEEGTHSFIHIDEVSSWQPGFHRWLSNQPKTVIVEGVSAFNDLDVGKPLIANTKILYDCRGKEPLLVDTPVFIFCTSSLEPLKFGANERRFYVIEMGV